MVGRLVTGDGHVVADEVIVARGLRDRARGFLGRPEPGDRTGLVLVGAKQIHTFGMRYPIDVVFCGRRGQILRVVRHLRPGRITRPVLRARWVAEMRAGAAAGMAEGDRLVLSQRSASDNLR